MISLLPDRVTRINFFNVQDVMCIAFCGGVGKSIVFGQLGQKRVLMCIPSYCFVTNFHRPSVRLSVQQQFTTLSYTIDARITKLICMIPLCIQMVAMYLKFFYYFQFWIIQILVILPKNAISLGIYHEIGSNFSSVWRDVKYIIYQTGFIVWLSDHLQKWKYRWRGGADFERKLFVTWVYQHLLLHYWC